MAAFMSGHGDTIRIGNGPAIPITRWGINELRVFLQGEGELPLRASSGRLHTEMLNVSDWPGVERQMAGLSYVRGKFEIGEEESCLETLAAKIEKWIKALLDRYIWVFHRHYNHIFQAIVDEISPSEEAVDSHYPRLSAGIHADFRSCGLLLIIPPKMQSHLPMIAAFEMDMPGCLGIYRDWCEEHEWQERWQDLDKQWRGSQSQHG